DFSGQLALWQVIARLLDQGSRLSAIRLAQVHAACDVLGIRRGFDENDLYENLSWLCQHQEQIELRLFAARRAQHMSELFLYDVTSSYLEGEDNAWALTATTATARKVRNRLSSACCATKRARRSRRKCSAAIRKTRRLLERRCARQASAL